MNEINEAGAIAAGVVQEVVDLLEHSGHEVYFGERVTQLEHALQCAAAAREAGADDEAVLAALLHDIGHLLGVPEGPVGVIDHDMLGRKWLLERGFSERVATLVWGHVNAKRYLTATNPAYASRLSDASVETLRLQGGPLTPAEAEAFRQQPLFQEMLQLRSWDEAAKVPGRQVLALESYRDLLARHLRR
ncbi:MAG: HD domain-containing protein [Acidobacteria bacterium]|nr:HD domain-containing protein [Acidobacteriota bacterium]